MKLIIFRHSIFLSLLLYIASCSNNIKTTQYENKEINTFIFKSVTHMQLGQFELARLNIEKALNIDNQDLNANNIAGLLYGKIKENALAIHHFSAALSISEDDPSTLNNYANYLCDSGNKAQAIDLFLKAALNRNNPQREIAYTNAGLCSLRIPNIKNAEEYFLRALEIYSDNQVVLFQVAQIRYMHGLDDIALSYLNRYAEIASHTPRTLKLGVQISRINNKDIIEKSYISILHTQFPESEEYHWAINTSNLNTQSLQPAL
jgi:type IV pilus assembly protein PilF